MRAGASSTGSTNRTFRRLVGDVIEGLSLSDLIAEAQADAVTQFLASAGPDWVRGTFGLATDPAAVPLDRVLWIRRNESGFDLIVDMDPDGAETTETPLLGLVDDLVQTQRELAQANQRLQQTLDDLETAAREVRRLREIVPICAWCRRIRVGGPDEPEWLSTEAFLARDDLEVSHGICEDCLKREGDADRLSGSPSGDRPR